MKLTRLPGLFLATLAAFLFLAGCDDVKTHADILKEKAQEYVAAHPELEPRIADAIKSNKIFKDMTMEQVKAAWGEPVEVEQYRQGNIQVWYLGCDWPHHCVSLDAGMSPKEQYQSRARFEGGKLSDWES